MPDTLPTRIMPSEDVLTQQVEDESVLLDLKTEEYYSLDDVGTRMWQLMCESGDPKAAVEALLQIYEVDEATLRRDMAQLIAELAAHGLVVVE